MKDNKMLVFEKSNTQIDVKEVEIVATRFVSTRLCMILVKHDGTIGDVAKKANRIIELNDTLFEELDMIRKSQD